MHKSRPKIFSYNSETIFIPNMTQSYLFQPTIPMCMLQWENHIENLTLILKLIQLVTKKNAYKNESKEATHVPVANR